MTFTKEDLDKLSHMTEEEITEAIKDVPNEDLVAIIDMSEKSMSFLDSAKHAREHSKITSINKSATQREKRRRDVKTMENYDVMVNKGDNASTAVSGLLEDPYASALLTSIRKYWLVPKTRDDGEIATRMNFYLDDCIKNQLRPTIEGMAMAIGISTSTFRAWSRRESLHEYDRYDLAQRFYQMVAAYDAQAVITGNMNAVAYIFRAKNFYDMQDKVETVHHIEDPLGEKVDPDNILATIENDID